MLDELREVVHGVHERRHPQIQQVLLALRATSNTPSEHSSQRKRGSLEDRRTHLRAWDAVLDGPLERVLLDVEELHRPPALKQRRLHTDGQAQSPFTVVRVTNQLRDLESRGGMLIDLTRTSGGGRPTDGFQGPVQRRIGRVTLASSSSRMLPSLNFLSVRISRDISFTLSLILEAVSSFSALTAVAYLPDEVLE